MCSTRIVCPYHTIVAVCQFDSLSPSIDPFEPAQQSMRPCPSRIPSLPRTFAPGQTGAGGARHPIYNVPDGPQLPSPVSLGYAR
ncbi:hypothetical protein M430DRAFT_33959 [Amorphotheca resinae ATCC 22711]|uniref:Uncharacterized protein n=1 Tax=Amorphotheca resinae ATCC 22711 TaxID=857342 RepID=A0A2T3B543_AMORE|nr:hypothetical protein M430DRAFT_33959 [Amorphotheca resinae ATCC 22711]PSS21890.1 hypothetical protein M430DRAFT_33959 [Amorphotheca resinae ATCC 22711]